MHWVAKTCALSCTKRAHESQLDVGKSEIEALVTDPYFVPEGTPLNTQLAQLQKAKQRFALVVDEYVDIQGMVSLEAILEEIVGEFTCAPASDELEIAD